MVEGLVWLNKDGCRLRLEEGGKEHVYRDAKELNSLISTNRNCSNKNRNNKRSRPDDNIVSPTSVQKAKK